MCLVMSRHGKGLENDAEYKRRLDAGLVTPPASAEDIVLLPYAKRSVAIFLGAVFVICLFGLFEGIRPTVTGEHGGLQPLSVSPIIWLAMTTAAALMLIFAKVKAAVIPRISI